MTIPMRTLEERYRRAEQLLRTVTGKVILNAEVHARWLGHTDCFWYERETRAGLEYRLVDAASGENRAAFDHAALAEALNRASGHTVDPENLPVRHMRLNVEPLEATFSAFDRFWLYSGADDTCRELPEDPAPKHWLVAPDGRRAAFVRNFNLWIRDLESGEERPLTYDGERYYAYANLADRTQSHALTWSDLLAMQKPEALWSPDSTRLLTLQTDDRKVQSLPVVHFAPRDGSLRPRVAEIRSPCPGDANVTEFRLVCIDVQSGEHTPARYPRIPDVRMHGTVYSANLAWWGSERDQAYFVELERGEQAARVVEWNTRTGATRIVFEERSTTYIDLNLCKDFSPSCLVPLPQTQELIWFSERSGWAHLYLYDLTTGAVKHPITRGEWAVWEILHFDTERRELLFTAGGRVAGRDPGYREVCRVNIDTGEIETLVSSDHDHVVLTPGDRSLLMLTHYKDTSAIQGVSPTGRYWVETFSRADTTPTTVVRNRDGAVVRELEMADLSALPEGWQWPERVKLVAADGRTDIYGLVFRPSDFDPSRPYPVLDYMYGGPQIAWVPKGSFNDWFNRFRYSQAAALAELGFITVMIDGRGSAWRSKAFHDESYANLETANNLEDHVAGIRQLAAKYPSMDITRVGAMGQSGGGYKTVRALLEHPDFYRVGAAASGNYDQRLFWVQWGERYQGLLRGDNYVEQAARHLTRNLKGKLLLVHGLLDAGCHPAALFQLVEAFIQENKDFDLVLLPNGGHAWTDYGLRRAWDHLVRHLHGAEPPGSFRLITGADGTL